ncbi:MAG: hypothetical protein ABID35_04275 [Candidatus Margulisiibacteriota bacterium]
MAKYDIVLVTNSPGELSALVKPVAETFVEKFKEARITLVLTPCQYTSGKELDYIKTIKGIANTVSADGYKDWILKNKKPAITFTGKGLVLYLGGDLAHAILVAKKLKYPAYAYVQDWIGWAKSYQKFFVPDEQSRNKLSKNRKASAKISVIGNLMVDSVADLPKWSPQPNVITFLPGSRHWQINHMTPIYKNIMAAIRSQVPEVKFQIVSSPFVSAKNIAGAKVIDFEEVFNSGLVITIPGTNTARLAAMGLPMISIFPLDDPDVIPLEGLVHYISLVPYLGSWFKRALVNALNKKVKYFALPNIKANSEIIPEIRGIIDPAVVAQKAVSLLKDRKIREKMSEDLIKAMGEPGAAVKITEAINEALQ